MRWTTLPLTLSLACLLACGDTGKTSDSATGDGSSSSNGSSGATTSTSSASAGTGTSDGSGGASEGQTTSGSTSAGTSGPGTSGPGTSSTSSTSGDATTGTSAPDSTGQDTGGMCQAQGASCAKGESCCDGLFCCEGVPVPPGQEFCSDNCPISDRNLKADFRRVDVHDVLARVAALDITTWRYKKDAPDVRHLGPMAQDFKAAFGLGDTDRMIFPLDATGVSMAAIQALHQRLGAAEAENDDLRGRLERLERRLAELEAR